jgi:hypothetical protein
VFGIAISVMIYNEELMWQAGKCVKEIADSRHINTDISLEDVQNALNYHRNRNLE